MAYSSRSGRRPAEFASKSSHSYVIKDDHVQEFLSRCNLPKLGDEVSLDVRHIISFKAVNDNPIKYIIAIDGGYTEVSVKDEFPSARICFFQFGALIFSVSDLETLQQQPFIEPSDISKLKRIQRLKFTLPVKNITLTDCSTITESVRKAVYDFFCQNLDDGQLITTLKWFLFQEYQESPQDWILASCPTCHTTNVTLSPDDCTDKHTFVCPHCNTTIYLTDVFRLHEAIDDELGAGGIAGYLTTLLEQIIFAHLVRLILKIKPSLLQQFMFIKDGPLAFFGQTANMHKPMRSLVNYLFQEFNLYFAGLEKSGAFVEHADEVADKIPNGSILILDNNYIYKYIIPGKADPSNPYGRTTYYSNKLIFKTLDGGIHVVSLPTSQILAYPKANDFRNLEVILTNIEKLKCDMYDNSLLPVALVNKLVSLSNHPSSRILQKFAMDSVHRR